MKPSQPARADPVGYIAKEHKEGDTCDTPSDVQPLHITGGNA